jgi:xylan 1,4-beta-xylosidase
MTGTTPPAPLPVAITVDAADERGELKPIHRFFGADEPNYAYLPDGRELLGEIGRLGPAHTYFRTHGLMVTGDGTPALKWGSTNMYTEDENGEPVYDWTIVDRIFDAYLAAGVRPYVQIGFMPQAMSVNPEPYQHHWRPGDPYTDIMTGWSYPPKDYGAWRDLVFRWVTHCVERYGRAEVEQWYWEVWNEANPQDGYWRGTPEEFRKLHDHAIDGVRAALPTAVVGGPDTAGPGGQWMRDFLDHCLRGTNHATGETGTPLDFVSFHAKGRPQAVDGHVRMGIATHLRDIDEGFAIVGSYPELRSTPVIIGECDPDGCAACTAEVYPQNDYRNTELYASYTAAVFARIPALAERHGVTLDGALTWAFEFEDEPLFAGFRVLSTTGGITLPVFNVFRMFGRLTGRRLAVRSDGEVPIDEAMRAGIRGRRPDVSAIAALDHGRLSVLAWHYHDDEVPGPEAEIALELRNLPTGAERLRIAEYRIDAEHSNAHTAWRRMGSPQRPTSEERTALRRAGRREALGEPGTHRPHDGALSLPLRLPRQGVSLLVCTWDEQEAMVARPVSGP